MSTCTYRINDASGKEEVITGQADMKAFLADGGLEQLLPGKVLPWRDLNSLQRDSSWVIRNKATGEAVMETFDRAKVDALNTEKYEAVPALQHLQELNAGLRKSRAEQPDVSVPAGQWAALPENERYRIVQGRFNRETAARVSYRNFDELSESDRELSLKALESQPLLVRALTAGVVSPSEYPTEEAAKSFNHVSHSPEIGAYVARNEFLQAVQREYDEAAPLAETAEQKAAMDSAIADFKAGYLRNDKAVMGVRSSAYSSKVAGGSKLDSKQVGKRNAALDRAAGSLSEWLQRARGSVKDAVLAARNDDQRAAERQAKDDKAAKRREQEEALIAQILGFKPGDTVMFGGYNISRVSKDRDGYPSSVTVDAKDLSDNKFNIAKILFGGDKDKLRAIVDAVRAKSLPDQPKRTALGYVSVSKVESPAQGVLANAIDQKERAWQQVKTLRAKIKDGETHLRLDLIKAEDRWNEVKRYEADARDQIEKDANKLGLTTKRNGDAPAVLRADFPKTITVDGVDRPTTNSKGQPIHPTEEGVRNFWRWFSPQPSQLLDGLSVSVISSLKRNAESLSNFIESQSRLPESDRFRVIPASVFAHMADTVDDQKILDAVVSSLPVDVMDFFGSQQLSAKEALHDPAVLENVFSINPASDVPLGINPSRIAELAIRIVANAGAKISSLTGGAFERNAAFLANGNNPIFSRHFKKSRNQDLSIIAGFGNSKAVDGSGRPLVLYHGTARDFSEFRLGVGGKGGRADTAGVIFATDSPQQAEFFGRMESRRSGDGESLMPVYLAINDPLVFDWEQRQKSGEESARLIADAKSSGKDGVIYRNVADAMNLSPASVFAAFSPEQIKSAIGNDGTFDGASSDIRLRTESDLTETPAFSEWFGRSKMTDKDGKPLIFMHGSPASFDAFSPEKLGGNSAHTSAGLGHFFTRDIVTAERYADGGNIYRGWLKIERPYVMPLSEAQAFKDVKESTARRAQLQKDGFDGVLILDETGKKAWATVAFEPWQFKSTDNNGNFDEFEDGFRLRDTAMRYTGDVPRADAENFIRKFVAEYPGAPSIMLVDSFDQLPKDIQKDALAQGSGPTRAKGAMKNGATYVVLNNHHSMADLQATIFHEIKGHAGIRKLLGPKFSQELNKLFVGLGGYSGLERIMTERGLGVQFHGYFDAIHQAKERDPDTWTDALATSILTEEVFAHIAEQDGNKTLMDRFKRIVGMVRDWLRRHGFAELAELGETDILFMLQKAGDGMRQGSGVVREGSHVGEKEIVDADGRPIAKESSPDYEALKTISGRLGLREREAPTVFATDAESGYRAGMDDENNVAGKQAPTRAGDVETGGDERKPVVTLKSEKMFGDRIEVKDGGRVHISWMGWGDSMSQLRSKAITAVMDAFRPKMPEGTYWRFTNNKSEVKLARARKLNPSTDHSSGTQEDGLSVTDGAHYSVFGYKYGYQVRGDVVGYGADGEPLLDVVTLEPVTGIIDANQIVELDRKARLDALSAKGWTLKQYQRFANGTFSIHDIDKYGPLNEPSASAGSDAPAVLRTMTADELANAAQPRGQMAKEVMGNVLSAFKQPTSKVFGPLHTRLSTQLHKAWVNKDYGKVFHLADSYERDISRFSANPAAAAPDLLPAFDNIRDAASRFIHGNKTAKLTEGVADALFSGTLAGEDVTEGRVWTDAELRDQFNLSDEQIKLYREARAAIDASLDATAAGLAWQSVKKYIPEFKDSVKAEPSNAETIIDAAMRRAEEELREVARYQAEVEADGAIPEGTAAKTLKKAQDVAEARKAAESIFMRSDALKEAGYAPLMRFGRFAVDVVETQEDGAEERLGFYKFETEIEAKMAAQKLQKEHPNATVTRSVMSEEAWKLFKGVDPDLVSLFADKVDGLEGLSVDNEVLQEWYRSAVNQRSAFKRMIHRKGVEGFDKDLTRVVASFITSNARVAARQFNMGDIAQAISDMQERKVSGDVVDEAVRLKEYMENPTEPFQALKGWMFAWFLGGSVASAALNLTQPLMMTLPYLSQYGAGKAAAQLTKAAKEAATNKVADEELKRALAKAAKDGKVDPQQVHHLYHEGMRPFLSKLPLGDGLRERAQGLMTLWGYMFGATENFNRRITFIAAYRMAKDDPSLGNPYDFAIKAIDETQGIYSKANRPNWARGTGPFGAIGVAAFTFKQYSIGYIELLVRMAKSGKNGRLGAAMMLGLLVMMSGIQGAPGADDLEDIIDTVSQYLGYTGNSRLAIRQKLRALLGEEAAKIVMHGGLSALPFDIAGRVGMGNLLPATAIFKPSEQNRASQFSELFGPPLSMSNQVLDAALAMESGAGIGGVANAFAPVAVRNLMKAYDMASTGEYRDSKGRKVTDVSLMDAAFKAGGLQPTVVSDEQKGARLVQMTGDRIRQVKAAINGLKARAIVENDNEMRAKADELLADWNRSNPDARIMPDGASVLRRVKEMRAERRARVMQALPREYRKVAEGEMN